MSGSRSESVDSLGVQPKAWWVFALIGLAGGALAGTFGVGGGVIMVPALVIFAALSQREAAATSLAAIIPTAAVGSFSYALNGNIDWIAALVLAIGAVLGAQLGTFIMQRVSQRALVWGFAGFQVVVIASLLFTTPQRSAEIEWSLGLLLLLGLVGLATGVLMGLLGVGGGVILVPALMIVFGASDLVAKGTSLIVMIPGAVSGTLSNWRKHLVNVRGALFVGLGAVVSTPIGAVFAGRLDPRIGNVLFAVFLIVIVTRMVIVQIRK